MKIALILALALLALQALANPRNCTSKEVEGYSDEYEHTPSEDGSAGVTFIKGNKARDMYVSLRAPEDQDEFTFTKSRGNVECSRENMTALDCAQYTCVVEEYVKPAKKK